MKRSDLPTPALVIEADAFERNLRSMAAQFPGGALRPHVKAHKCTSLAAKQVEVGHRSFTCATPHEVVGMAEAGIGDDLLLANESIDPIRLARMAAVQHLTMVTIAVDSPATVDAAARAGLRHVIVDVNVGLPRCGALPEDAGRIADLARAAGMEVRGVMGYEGHLMMVDDRGEQAQRVADAMGRLIAAHELVGGDIVSAGGTGTAHLHHVVSPGSGPGVTEVQAGSYALMDSHYARLVESFEQAAFVLGTVISVGNTNGGYAVADVGLKAVGMDHGNPTLATGHGSGGTVWFLSDEHITFRPDQPVVVGDRVHVVPAHIDPTMAMHAVAWLVDGDEVVDRWPIDLRGW